MQNGKPRVDMKVGGTAIFLIATDEKSAPAPVAPYAGIDHFGFIVEDLDAAYADLKAKGVVFTMEPTQLRPEIRISFVRAPGERLDRDPRAQEGGVIEGASPPPSQQETHFPAPSIS
jgi:catechol 2,3-dioxygenase-like lactoylglutathione lyase family enzyme